MSLFTPSDVWSGGFYELALEYGRSPDAELINALAYLWSLPNLEGCYLDPDREPNEQPRLEFDESLVEHGHLRGVATLPNGARVACATCCVRECEGSDWLIFYCPMGALAKIYPVGGFPFGKMNHDSWRVPMDAWLVDIGRRVFERTPFRLGLVGFEASSGDYYADEVSVSALPDKRYVGFLMPTKTELVYYARTED